MAKFGFDVSEVDASATSGGGSREPIESGNYTLKALEAEEKETKSGGTMIKVKFEVVGVKNAGHWIWQNFNITNKSEKAQAIGRQQLVAWATACGKPNADDTDKLIDKPFKAAVGISKGTGGYADSNEVKAFLFEEDEKPAVAAKPAAKATPAPAVKPAGKTANPWD